MGLLDDDAQDKVGNTCHHPYDKYHKRHGQIG
jgi:hypothetical protein